MTSAKVSFSEREQYTLIGRLERAARPGVGRTPHAGDASKGRSIGVRFIDQREQARYLGYDELLQRARCVAVGLQRAGLRPGDRAALILPTAPEFYDAFFGVLLCGAVPVPLYPPVRLGRFEEYHPRTAAMLLKINAQVVISDARIRRVLGATMDVARSPLGLLRIEQLRKAGEGCALDLVHVDPDELALIQFSSGTVAAPKGIALTHRQVLANATRIGDALFAAYPEEGFAHAGCSWLPLYHDMGLVGCLVVGVALPGELTLIPPELFVARPAVWLRAISRYRATISPAPNFAYALCTARVRDEELQGVDLSGWRMALNGAEPVTVAALERFNERFSKWGLSSCALTPVYGLAEATLAVTFSPPGRPFLSRCFERDALESSGEAREVEVPSSGASSAESISLVSLGRPLQDFELKIVAEDGDEDVLRDEVLPPGRLGRVLVRGPSLMRGYEGCPETTAKVLDDEGWLDTGDRGFLCDDELYLYGRAKDIIILRGRNYAPQQIEQALDDLPGLRAGCVVAVALPAQGDEASDEASEGLALLMEHTREAAEDHATLIEGVHQRLSSRLGLVPARVEVLEPGVLPRTSSGKLRRIEARRRLLAGELFAPTKVTPLKMLGHMLRSSLSMHRADRAREER
ncbi:MAG: fatty acyl-AMP ligase [Deltaproteobacteria bacterium]|nr:fatty acyl-AMP ligase [Deltaproteobacteria bacterium]